MGPFTRYCVSLFSTSSQIINYNLYLITCNYIKRVGIKMVAQLSAVNQAPDGLILESPFNNIRDVFRNHPLTIVTNTIK